MDQAKIGSFLKELRKEKNLTQEQLSERFSTSSRTISRWENGKNLPDLGTLIELAAFYDVDLSEIIDGERKKGASNGNPKEALSQAAEYAEEEKKKQVREIFTEYAGGLLGAVLFWLVFRTLGWLSDGEITGILFLAAFCLLVVGYMKTCSDAKQTKLVQIVYLVLAGVFYVVSVLNLLDGIVPLGIFFLVFGTVFFCCFLKAVAIKNAWKRKGGKQREI